MEVAGPLGTPLGLAQRKRALLRGSQAPRRAVCGTRGSLQTMHGGGSAPSCCAFSHRVAFDGCESWTIKKAECWRIDAFELWRWRRLLRVPWTARRPLQDPHKWLHLIQLSCFHCIPPMPWTLIWEGFHWPLELRRPWGFSPEARWISLQSKGLSRVFSNATVQKHQFFGTQPVLTR